MTSIAGYNGAIYITTNTSSVSMTNESLNDSGDHMTFVVANSAHRYWDNTATPVVQAEWDDLQTITITGSPTGGTFTLTFGGQTTAGIAYNAAASAVQSALQALSSIGAGNATVTGSAGGPWVVEFTGTLGYASQSVMTKNNAGLTGGTSPDVSIAHTQTGQTWTTQSTTLYKVQYVGGKIIFTSALSGTPQVRLSSGGKYFAYTTFAQGTSWELAGTVDMADVSVLGGGRAKQFLPTLFTGTFTMKAFWVDATFLTNIQTGFLLIFSGSTNGTNRYEAYVYTKDSKIMDAVSKTVDQDLSFQVSGAWYYN